MQDPNSNQQNADTSSQDSFPSPDGPQKATTTTNLDTGEVEPLRGRSGGEKEDLADLATSGSDGGSGEAGTAS